VTTAIAKAYRPTANTEEGIRIINLQETTYLLKLPSTHAKALAAPKCYGVNETIKSFIMNMLKNPARSGVLPNSSNGSFTPAVCG
jgi:hypothetical protein